ncbi:transglutaminase TgpA family protein [Rhodocyclus tenuis]|uniref:Transglutaminase-like putative cysteine protease n=1 Tax=Rhodocyclus tenuis TaxID=1066 RepID=A0A840G529_RHOTE|nr:DUF3488 and transglutaminase-like domain-containing protein [Rhodocyclus tenuis]MBB4247036.1 transglutaminase-like putative cysteine protease [Rhodocyclus tenuis]
MAKAEPAPVDRGALPWLLAAALATAAPHAGHLPVWLSLLAGALLLWRVWLWRQNASLPPRWLLALLTLAGVAAIGWQYRTLFGRDAGVALLFLFMAAKPMEMRTRRDALVLVMLGYFLLLTHFFYAQSIPVGAWLLATATLLSAVLIRLYGGAQTPRSIGSLAAKISLQALPLSLLLFLLFPRVAGPLWGLPQDAHAGVSGLSERMAPGSISSLIQSGAIAMRVRFAGAIPPQSDLYWRGPVFDDYDGQTWRALPAPAGRASAAPTVAIAADARSVSYASTLEAHNQRWLLALDLPTTLPAGAELSGRLAAIAREPVRSRGLYNFSSTLDFVANRDEAPEVLQQALQLPEGFNPRARALAAGWRGEAPGQIINRALSFFGEQSFAYTLQPPLLGRDAVDDFLFAARRGFCEHYAGAFVFLMRAAGVPARVVAGYQGGEENPVDGYLVVRQSDAHAWAEVWLAGRGWQRVDPTAAVAPARVEQGVASALPAGEELPLAMRFDAEWMRALRYRWEAVNNSWNQWVLGYTPERQRDTLARLGLGKADWRTLTLALGAAAGIALTALTLAGFRRGRPLDPAEHEWQRFCRQLRRRGLIRADWEGPLAFAARVADERPELAALTTAAAGHYAVLRYGHGNADNLVGLRQCVRDAAHAPARLFAETSI